MIKNVSRSVIVDVPVERAYEVWSEFTPLPFFERPVDQVRVEGRRLRWPVRREEWDALIADFAPEEAATWHRLDGPRFHAVVSMSPTDDRRTKVTLGAAYEVPAGEPDDKSLQYEVVLRGFKEYAEAASAAAPRKRIGATRK
jgi:uncharacterized membrane protein